MGSGKKDKPTKKTNSINIPLQKPKQDKQIDPQLRQAALAAAAGGLQAPAGRPAKGPQPTRSTPVIRGKGGQQQR